jgi:hypothetical protein
MALVIGCQPPGVVTNRQEFNMNLNSMKLDEFPALKVFFGGAVSEIPLKSIQELVIDHSNMIQYEDELYYSARIVLKDGTTISPNQKSSNYLSFISVQNTISGKRGYESFKIGLQDVERIEIHQK